MPRLVGAVRVRSGRRWGRLVPGLGTRAQVRTLPHMSPPCGLGGPLTQEAPCPPVCEPEIRKTPGPLLPGLLGCDVCTGTVGSGRI